MGLYLLYCDFRSWQLGLCAGSLVDGSHCRSRCVGHRRLGTFRWLAHCPRYFRVLEDQTTWVS